MTYYYNDPFTSVIPSAVDNMIFVGWYDSSDLTSPNSYSNIPDHDLYLYAKWIEETFVLSFETNGGTEIEDVEVKKNDLLDSLTTPVRSGYLFLGWYYDQSLTSPIDPTSPITTDLVIYASWEVDPSVTFALKYYTYSDVSFDKTHVSQTTQDYYFRGYLIQSNHHVYVWGNNQGGLLGVGHSNAVDGLIDMTSFFNLNEDELVTDIAVGTDVTVAITNHERLFVWGFNTSKQLTSFVKKETTNSPQDITEELNLSATEKILQIEAADQSVYVITSLGRILTWGANSMGELGNGTTNQFETYTEIQSHFQFQSNEKLIDIKAGLSHVVAYSNMNRVFTWGSNLFGQLGSNSNLDSLTPQDITYQFGFFAGETVVTVEAGNYNTFLATNHGRIFFFGRNEGEFGNESLVDKTVPTEIKFPFSVKDDLVVSMDAGDKHILITTESGRVITSGNLLYGKLGDNNSYPEQNEYTFTFLDITNNFKLSNTDRIVIVGAAHKNSYATSSSGKLFAWGHAESYFIPDNITYMSDTPENVTDRFNLYNDEMILDMQSSNNEEQHYLAMTSQQRVFAWGNNRNGQLGFISTDKYIPYPVDITSYLELQENEYVIRLACGKFTSYVLTNLKRVISFGANKQGQTGINVTSNISAPTDVTPYFSLNSSDFIIKIFAVETVAYAITEQGKLYGWGQYGLGDGTSTQRKLPINLTHYFDLLSQETIQNIYGSESARFVVTSNNRMFVWGTNDSNQLGYPSQFRISVPTLNNNLTLNDDETILDIYCGTMHTLILTSSHRVLLMGRNPGQSFETLSKPTYYETPTDVTSFLSLDDGEYVTAMIAGITHTILLTSNHRILSFGNYSNRGLGVVINYAHDNSLIYDITESFLDDDDTQVVMLFGSLYSHFVITTNQNVYSWGRNESGQLANGHAENIYLPKLLNIKDYILYKTEFYHIDEDVTLESYFISLLLE